MQNRVGVAAVDAAGEQNHVGTKTFDLVESLRCKLKRRRADDLSAGAERRLVRGLDGQTGHVADDRDPQSAGSAARCQDQFTLEHGKILRRAIEKRVALVQLSEREQ